MLNKITFFKNTSYHEVSFRQKRPKHFESNNIIHLLNNSEISAIRKINENTLSGSTLEMQPEETFCKLKKMGLDTIVDLRLGENKNYFKKCSEACIKYFKFPLDFIFSPGKSDIFVGKNRSSVNDSFVDNLSEFLKLVRNGNLYMGCQYGRDRTNFAIILNYLFNFNSKDTTPEILSSDIGKSRTLLNKDLDLIRKIIKKLSNQQKKRLNLPNNYNEILIKRIKALVLNVR